MCGVLPGWETLARNQNMSSDQEAFSQKLHIQREIIQEV